MRHARLLGLVCLGLLAVLPAGCSRVYWRRNADAEAYGLILEKSRLDARWAQPRLDVIPSPLSRNFDPNDPDFGSLPPDDPTAHRYMERMSDCNRIRGSRYWDRIGMSDTIENPAWVASLPPEGATPPDGGDPERLPPNPAAPETVPPNPVADHSDLTTKPSALADVAEHRITRPLRSLFDKFAPAPPGRASVATADAPPVRAVVKPAGTLATAAPSAKTVAVSKPAASAKPSPAPAKAKPGDIQLASFQEEPPAPPPAPAPEGNRPLDRPADQPLPLPLVPEEPPHAAEPENTLSPEPGEAETVRTPVDDVDLTQANPALPEVTDLTLEEAARLAYLHNRNYQTQLEQVYLAALDLAFNRFQFDVRWLGISGTRPQSDLNYSNTPGGTESLTATNRIGLRRVLPAGGQWAVEFLNNTVWLFSDAKDESSTASTLSYSVIQPLLFQAGRKVVLENLTQAERNLLYAVRDLAVFRQTFFVAVVSGGGINTGTGGLGTGTGSVGGGGGGGGGGGASGGYLGLLESIQTIANQEDNIRRLTTQLEIAQANTVTADPLSTLQLQSQLLGQQNSLRSSRQQLQNQIDQFKIQLGLPPDLKVALDTKLLKPFLLIAPELVELELSIDETYFDVARRISPTDPSPDDLRQAIATLGPLAARIRSEGIPLVEEDIRRTERDKPYRLANVPPPVEENRRRINADIERDKDLLGQLREALNEQDRIIGELPRILGEAETVEQRRAVLVQAGTVEETLERIAQNLEGIQVGLRTELIRLNPFELPLVEAVGYGLTNRMDLMNQRALVTDARRKVEVAANALQAVLNVRVEGDVRTRPLFNNDNPLDFRNTQSNYRAGLSFTAPLDQIQQRNAYRASQISYQRARRTYTLAEDNVKAAIRADWRQIEVLKQNFEVARYSLRVAAKQYDLAVEQATGPARTGGGGTSGGGGGGGGGGSTSGLNLINALSRLLQSQNQLIGIWVDYETARLNIYRDMGIMEVDGRGLWCDPFYQNGMAWPDGLVGTLPGQGGPAGGSGAMPGEPAPPEPAPPELVPQEPSPEPLSPRQKGGPDVNPPAPAPSGGVEPEGTGPSGAAPAATSATPRPSSPAGHGVRPAAHSTAPPLPPSREAGHGRSRQPIAPERHPDRAAAGSGPQARKGKAEWRPAGAKAQAG